MAERIKNIILPVVFILLLVLGYQVSVSQPKKQAAINERIASLENKNTALILTKQQNFQIETLPDWYWATVIQVGGIGSDLYTHYAKGQGKYLDKDEYAQVSFNNINDILYLDCKDGYKAVEPQSSNGDKSFSHYEVGNFSAGYGIEIKDIFKNELNIKCEKIK